ncbi:MAG: excinuclease ABC subunit UvrC [Thermodesulfobacteriota bacterium]
MIESKKTLLKKIPKKTGIYLMKNMSGKPIYIGKAKDLKSRVSSYFNLGGDNRPQIQYLIKEIESIDFIITKDEREALILENSLIKTHKPKYNIRLKDDKSYSFLALTVKEKFPKLIRTRRIKENGTLYYGPFASAGALKQTKKLIHKLFQVRDCSDEKFKRYWQRPCLNYNLHLCLGPCAKKVDQNTYDDAVNQAKSFLNGDKKDLVRILKKDMYRAAEVEDFDEAMYFRDQIKLLEKDLEVQKVLSSNLDDRDIIGVYKSSDSYEVVVMFSRFGSIVDSSEYSINNFHQDDREVMQQFISRFYQDGRYIPTEILVNKAIENKTTYEDWLSDKKGKKVSITVPKRGAKRKLIEFAEKNAEESFNRKHSERLDNLTILKNLKKSLSLKKVPKTIECFDISNIQGKNAVASLVRFLDAKPDKSRYRRYKVKTVKGPDDYASMFEILGRRIKRIEQEKWDQPDLIMIDGGKGQLNIAAKAISDLGYLDRIDLISIAKGRKEGEIDKIYVFDKKKAHLLNDNKDGLYLLMRVRDEAHRFAIEYHKKIRAKTFVASGLDNVPGVGRKRRTILLNHFGSLAKIKSATAEEIASIPGLNKKIAGEIKRFFT